MALSTFGDVKTAIGVYLDRADLAGYIPDFVRLAERRIAYGSSDPYPSQPLRVPAMQTRTTGTITSNAIAFPTGFLEPILVRATSGSSQWQLEGADLGTFTKLQNSELTNNFTDLPTVYVILNNRIETAGLGASDYILDYYKAFDALSADADTNWLLTNAPDVYLFGALIESAPFLMDAQSTHLLPAWYGMYKAAINSLNMVIKRTGPLRVRAN
jgi:hypothetical protein